MLRLTSLNHHFATSLQLLALYMSNLAQLLKSQKAKYQLELDFATFHVVMALEGWGGLEGFGGSRYFSGSASAVIQGVHSSKATGTITTEQLDLAHVSDAIQPSP